MIVVPLNAAGSIGPRHHSFFGADTQSFKLKATLTQSGKTLRRIRCFTPEATRHRVSSHLPHDG